MKIFDPIYGPYDLPWIPGCLVATPEFRRLSQIRLLNAISPSLATLGEIKRYSHTLGVLHLALRWEERHRGQFERRVMEAFRCSIILHDIATPPFAHLFEYVVKERKNWDHESAIVDVLLGRHRPENVAHQFFGGQRVRTPALLRKVRVDMDVLMKILAKEHPLSQLILGSLDFDNIDNVFRMAWSLGIGFDPQTAIELAMALSVTSDGKLSLAASKIALVSEWARTRKSVYDVLVFDGPTVAAQAVLTRAIFKGFEGGVLDDIDWSMTDEDLLAVLRSHRETKDWINLRYLGQLPQHVATIQFKDIERRVATRDRPKLLQEIEQLAESAGIGRPLAYIFRDSGTFSKKLNFYDPDSNTSWSFGQKSESTIIYVFSEASSAQTKEAALRCVDKLRRQLCTDNDDVLRVGILGEPVDAQQPGLFAFSS